jgi:hypothetical protein
MSTSSAPAPSPQRFITAVEGFQKTAIVKAGVELGVFTAIAEGHRTIGALSKHCKASERGLRILCDVLCVQEFLTKQGDEYGLTPDSAAFLDSRSPDYIGIVTEFLLAPAVVEGFSKLTDAVRKGGTAVADAGTVAPDHPAWVGFARGMAPFMADAAKALPKLVDPDAKRPLKILDLAAGHGLYGIEFLKHHPQSKVVALDWAAVVAVASENARRYGVADRHSTIAGSAFDADWGTDYDVVLNTNFIHHFDAETNERLMRKVHAALVDGGRAVTVDFFPPENRISPSGYFSIIMLATTPKGDTYTFGQFEQICRRAGFEKNELHPFVDEEVVISTK